MFWGPVALQWVLADWERRLRTGGSEMRDIFGTYDGGIL
jgi:hypothetical protein